MANAFSRSWEIAKLSFNVMKHGKELLAFPILAAVFSVIFIAVMLFPSIIFGLVSADTRYAGFAEYLILFLAYLGFITGQNWQILHVYFRKFDYLILAAIVIGIAWMIWKYFRNKNNKL